MPKASSLEEELREVLGLDVELIPGKGGIFDVKLDGDMVFSKKVVGRFPEHDEVIRAIRQHKKS